jgi:threonine/homoserine/homoserine lactone efflux protein
MKERRALGVMLVVATIIPVSDMLTVLSKSYNTVQQAIPHIVAIIICSVVGVLLLATKPPIQAGEQDA